MIWDHGVIPTSQGIAFLPSTPLPQKVSRLEEGLTFPQGFQNHKGKTPFEAVSMGQITVSRKNQPFAAGMEWLFL